MNFQCQCGSCYDCREDANDRAYKQAVDRTITRIRNLIPTALIDVILCDIEKLDSIDKDSELIPAYQELLKEYEYHNNDRRKYNDDEIDDIDDIDDIDGEYVIKHCGFKRYRNEEIVMAVKKRC